MKKEIDKYRNYIGYGLISVATAYILALNISDNVRMFGAAENIQAIKETIICGLCYLTGFKLIKK